MVFRDQVTQMVRQRSRQTAISRTVLWGMVAPGRGSTSDGMRRLRWGSDFGAA